MTNLRKLYGTTAIFKQINAKVGIPIRGKVSLLLNGDMPRENTNNTAIRLM